MRNILNDLNIHQHPDDHKKHQVLKVLRNTLGPASFYLYREEYSTCAYTVMDEIWWMIDSKLLLWVNEK